MHGPESAALILARFEGRFRLREEYSGGEGRTLRVVEPRAGRDLVLKLLPPGVEPQEAALLLSLRHPAIPAVREVGRLGDGRAFVLRDHVAGQPLTALPARPEQLLPVLCELLEVLAFVHLRSIVHLDLKPQNLLRDDAGRLHLLDFGLGVRRGAHGRGGTPFFAAPELLLGGVPDARADLFSVGALAAAAAWPRGRPPLARFVSAFPDQDFFEAGGVRADEFPPPLDRFLPRCLSRRPARRFQDAQAALEFLSGGSGRPTPFLLAPDPAQLFAPELRRAAVDTGADVELAGGTAADRQWLAMQLVATLPGARALRAAAATLRVCRTGKGPLRIALPALDETRLLPHLHSSLGLQGQAAQTAARWLLARGCTSGSAVHAELLQLVARGEIVAAGSRWSWPAALAGRLGAAAAQDPEPTAANVHAAAARGQRERAIALWRRGAADQPEREPALRQALAAGLLDAGEPAQALPFCALSPRLRAEALLDMGQVAAAGVELAASAPQDEPRDRCVRARWLVARSERAQAIRLLDRADATPRERLIQAAALEEQGDAAACIALLHDLLPALPAAEQPFLRASALTALGHALRRQGDLAAARAQFTAAAELLFALGHLRHAATARLNLGVIAKDLGEHELAVEHLRAARAQYEHAGDAAGAAIAAANLGIVALARGDAAAARPWLEDAAPRLLQLGNLSAGRLAQVMLARARAELGEVAAARGLLQAMGELESDRLRAEAAHVQAVLETSGAPPAVAAAAAPETTTAPDSMPPTGPSRELFRTFLTVNRQLAQEHDLARAMQRLLDAAVTLTGGRHGYLLVARQDGVRREFQSGDPGPGGQAFSRSLANRAMDLQRTLTGDEALADRDLREMPSIRNLQTTSAICAPFRSAGGTKGALYVEHPGRASAFHAEDKESLEVLADQAAIAVDRMLREEALARELEASRRELAVAQRTARRASTQLLGDSAPMQELRAQVQRLAPLDLPVLILGETGTGKELVARALHEQGPRGRGPFVAENCSALSAELMERELFGHVQGAFTGADRDRPGLLELADGGTLFLDEVGDMSPPLQAKLLRALQEQTFRRVGGSDDIRVSLRLLAATHKDLRAMVQRGEFREDLFFRLAAVELRLPPLRERPGDVALLAGHFLRRHDEQHGVRHRFAAAALAALEAYPWPGNVRELDHVVARACLLADAEEIVDLQLPVPARPGAAAKTAAAPPAAAAIVTLKEAERQAIAAALQRCGGDKAKTARALGISRTALYEKLGRHGLR